jgi:diaminopimelate epimerase
VSRLPFAKVQGLGNDFVVVDLRPGKPGADVSPAPTEPEVARALCDRNFGIGGDGVLAILPGRAGPGGGQVGGDARMRVINADGSEAEMCGNGIRCVAKYLYEKDATLRRPVINIDTGAGLLACAIDADSNGEVRTVSVDMGQPRLTRGEVPVSGPAQERAVRAPLQAHGRAPGDGERSFAFTAVSMGNPHAVMFIDDPAVSLRALAESYGPQIETDPLFPRRTNVEFARVRSSARAPEIDVVVWERGVGITLACGTGACATAVAACLEGRVSAGIEIPVFLPGGPLFITVRQADSAKASDYAGVTMRGPAALVFEAQVDLGALLTRRSGKT